MNRIPLNIYRTERTCRTNVFARTTTDATLGIYHWEIWRLRIVLVLWHHLDSAIRAMTCAVAASHAVGVDNTVFLNPHCMTYLYRSLFVERYRTYSAVWACLRTSITFWAAISALIPHLWLHKAVKFRRRTKHTIRASRDAQLASGAMLRQIAYA